MSTDDDDLKVRQFLRDHYGPKNYALLTGPHTITNIPVERLPFLIATILLDHAGGLDKAIEALREADFRIAEIENKGAG